MQKLIAAVTVLAVSTAQAEVVQIDPSTQAPVVISDHTAIPEGPGSISIEVLWDLTHGVLNQYEPSGSFSDLVSLLSPEGYTFTTTDAGIDNIDLSPYEILVICVGSAWDSPYTAAEVEAAESFFQSGGSILVLGDNRFANPQNINPIAEAFGTTTGVTSLSIVTLTQLAAHPIFVGIDEVYLQAGGSLDSVPPSLAVAWTDANVPAISVVNSTPGSGCVTIVGDIDLFSNAFFHNADNQAFAISLFGWLATCAPPSCFSLIDEEIVCHADGTTFTVNVEGLNACTGGTSMFTFTASGGAVGEEMCFTLLVDDGGFCCTTEICVTIPDCTPAALPSDLDGDGIVGMVDFLAVLAAWGSCSDCGTCPADFNGDCSVGILDLLILLGNWTA